MAELMWCVCRKIEIEKLILLPDQAEKSNSLQDLKIQSRHLEVWNQQNNPHLIILSNVGKLMIQKWVSKNFGRIGIWWLMKKN